MTVDTQRIENLKRGWYNLQYKPFQATLHLTYYEFQRWSVFDSLLADSRKLVNKHLQKADDIIEENVSYLNPEMKGLIFRIEGNTATNYNFYLTDSAKHFLRGALYFNNRTNTDSIAPVYDFIKQDIQHMIRTFHWK